MKILIADDEPLSLQLLKKTLESWNYEVVAVSDGQQALAELQGSAPPRLAVLDWMMPGIDRVEVCRRARERLEAQPIHLMLLTSRSASEDIAEALQAGADDSVTKPFDRAELRARLSVGERMVRLESELRDRVQELENALERVKQLQGLIPICSYCKKVRDDSDYWHRVERYIEKHTSAQFGHGVCPDCYEKILKPQIEQA